MGQGLIEKNNLGVGNVNTPATRYVLGYYNCTDYLNSGVNSIFTNGFLSDYNISYYNTLKMKKKLFVFILLSFFISLINLGAPIRGAQIRYAVFNFGLNQPLGRENHLVPCFWEGVLPILYAGFKGRKADNWNQIEKIQP